MNTKRYSYMEENVNQTEKEMAENEKQNQTSLTSVLFLFIIIASVKWIIYFFHNCNLSFTLYGISTDCLGNL